MRCMKRVLAGVAVALWLVAPACGAAAGAASEDNAVHVVVDGTAISVQQFDAALQSTIRQKFYHRQPPEDQLPALRNEVTDSLVNRVLLLKEAERRGVAPDEEQVRARIEAFDQRYRGQPQWQGVRDQLLAEFTLLLRQQSMLERLEAAIRVAPPSTESGLRAYYASHPEQFTQPEQVRLSMILLKVDPAAPSSELDQARQQAQDIVKQLANGADFAALAREHSRDDTASKGGDMGLRHRGMLPQGIEIVVDKLTPGRVSEPLRLLEGVAVLRLTERKPALLKALEEVRVTLAELWAREQGETQWRELRARLRAGADIRVGINSVGAVAGAGSTDGAAAAH